MKSDAIQKASPVIKSLIIELRGQKLILDVDLARIYGVPTKTAERTGQAKPQPVPY